MNKTEQLANRLREVVLNGTWIADTNYKDLLEDVDWKIKVVKFQGFYQLLSGQKIARITCR